MHICFFMPKVINLKWPNHFVKIDFPLHEVLCMSLLLNYYKFNSLNIVPYQTTFRSQCKNCKIAMFQILKKGSELPKTPNYNRYIFPFCYPTT